jgi:archaemetzincin
MIVVLFLGDEPSSNEVEAVEPPSAAAGCLVDVAPLDVRPGRQWRSFWQRLDTSDCRSGSWLSRYSEEGQSLEQFRLAQRQPAVLGRALEIRRLGPPLDGRPAALLPLIREFLGVYFQRPSRRAPALPLPSSARRPSQGQVGQYDAAVLLETLEGTCPTETLACLAVTAQDLSLEGLDYVLGLGEPRERVGVMSTFRLLQGIRSPATPTLRPARPTEQLRRALKVAAHEVGHQLGLAHCRHFRGCVMAGSNSLAASDRSHLMLCPLEHAKLRWELEFDPYLRFAELADFAAKHGLHKEGAYWARMAESVPRYPQAAGAAAP